MANLISFGVPALAGMFGVPALGGLFTVCKVGMPAHVGIATSYFLQTPDSGLSLSFPNPQSPIRNPQSAINNQ
jgi:hypothetical protein